METISGTVLVGKKSETFCSALLLTINLCIYMGGEAKGGMFHMSILHYGLNVFKIINTCSTYFI